jgi:hypothetical protein
MVAPRPNPRGRKTPPGLCGIAYGCSVSERLATTNGPNGYADSFPPTNSSKMATSQVKLRKFTILPSRKLHDVIATKSPDAANP